MFTNSSTLVEPGVLLTLVCEDVLKESLLKLFQNLKVRGYSITPAQAENRYGERIGEWEGDRLGIEIKVLVSTEISDVILHAIQQNLSEFPVLAYRQTVEVFLR
jgi:hypothetical protein